MIGRRSLALLILPAAFTAVLFAMRASSLPFWQSFNLDPDYYYLLNGLMLVEMLAPTDISHPGTPVQVLIALVLRLMHPSLPAAGVVEAVLDQPEAHLVMVTTVMFPLVGLGLFWLGRVFLTATGNLMPALLAQSAPFLSMIIPKFGLHPKPEAFLIIAVAPLMAAALHAARAERLEDRHAIWLGMAIGFGIACKIHFVAMGLVPLFLLDRRRLFLVLPLATAAGFFLFVSPALPSWQIFVDWWGRVAVSSGAYGTGAATVIDPTRYPRAFFNLFASKLIFTAVFLAGWAALAGYVRLRRRGLIAADPFARLLAGILLAQLATVVLVAKQSAAHYMVPAVMMTGPAMAVLWVVTARMFPERGHARGWLAVAVLLVVVQVPATWKQNAELARWSKATMGFDMTPFAACAKIDFDASSSLPYALQRGDMNAQARYSPKLATRMPADQYTWFTNDHSYWKRGFMQWNQPRDFGQVLAAYPCAVFRGTQAWTARSEAQRLAPGFVFDDHCFAGEDDFLTKGIKCSGEVVRPLAN
jgi:hypothetical protein